MGTRLESLHTTQGVALLYVTCEVHHMTTFRMGETVDRLSIGDDSNTNSSTDSDIDEGLLDCMVA